MEVIDILRILPMARESWISKSDDLGFCLFQRSYSFYVAQRNIIVSASKEKSISETISPKALYTLANPWQNGIDIHSSLKLFDRRMRFLCQFFDKFWLRVMKILMASTIMGVSSLTIEVNYAEALENCQSPLSNEYLLVVVTDTQAEQDIVRRSLPPDITIARCRYFDKIVSTVRGFDDQEVASDWARYVQDIVGLSAYVVKPDDDSALPNTPLPVPPEIGFNPQPLGTGYAVLVDYSNQPEIALQLERSLGRNVGLVVYGQKPFLLVTYTQRRRAATNSLFNLSDRGFLAFVVDSSRVTLISPRVQLINQ